MARSRQGTDTSEPNGDQHRESDERPAGLESAGGIARAVSGWREGRPPTSPVDAAASAARAVASHAAEKVQEHSGPSAEALHVSGQDAHDLANPRGDEATAVDLTPGSEGTVYERESADAADSPDRRPAAVREARPDLEPAPQPGDASPPEDPSGLEDLVTDRTQDNRIQLADDRDIDGVRDYGGYLDVAIHGDETSVQADFNGERVNLSFEEFAHLIETSPAWRERPIRLIACEVGRGDYAQQLADRLGSVVYAPTDAIGPTAEGRFQIADGGRWRRFEPGLSGS